MYIMVDTQKDNTVCDYFVSSTNPVLTSKLYSVYKIK